MFYYLLLAGWVWILCGEDTVCLSILHTVNTPGPITPTSYHHILYTNHKAGLFQLKKVNCSIQLMSWF